MNYQSAKLTFAMLRLRLTLRSLAAETKRATLRERMEKWEEQAK